MSLVSVGANTPTPDLSPIEGERSYAPDESEELGMARRDITGAVDFPYLENYAANDRTVIEEVLGIFREQSALWMRLLDPAGPSDTWRDGAHTMKGAALGVGAFQLGEACAAAEAGADAGPGEKQAALERVRTALDAALSDIAAYQHEMALQSLRSPGR